MVVAEPVLAYSWLDPLMPARMPPVMVSLPSQSKPSSLPSVETESTVPPEMFISPLESMASAPEEFRNTWPPEMLIKPSPSLLALRASSVVLMTKLPPEISTPYLPSMPSGEQDFFS